MSSNFLVDGRMDGRTDVRTDLTYLQEQQRAFAPKKRIKKNNKITKVKTKKNNKRKKPGKLKQQILKKNKKKSQISNNKSF